MKLSHANFHKYCSENTEILARTIIRPFPAAAHGWGAKSECINYQRYGRNYKKWALRERAHRGAEDCGEGCVV